MTKFPDLPKPPDVAGVLRRIREGVEEAVDQGEAIKDELQTGLRASKIRKRRKLPTEGLDEPAGGG